MSQPTTEDLLEKHFAYEVRMLQEVYHRMGQMAPEKDALLLNALGESFAIHARALIEFFTKEHHKVAAPAHAPAYAPFARKTKSKWGTWRQRLNNQVAHLLEGRTNLDSEKIGDDQRFDIYQALQAETVEFKSALAQARPGLKVPELGPMMKVTGVGPSNEIIAFSFDSSKP